NSKGRIELKIGSAIIYAIPSRFIVEYQESQTIVKVGNGTIKLEFLDDSIVLKDGETIQIENGILASKSKFNPLSEKW
ncbi:hypothetical protein MJH12_17845, partial [bacterium]|nr:hypothetical protein [bacterium]